MPRSSSKSKATGSSRTVTKTTITNGPLGRQEEELLSNAMGTLQSAMTLLPRRRAVSKARRVEDIANQSEALMNVMQNMNLAQGLKLAQEAGDDEQKGKDVRIVVDTGRGRQRSNGCLCCFGIFCPCLAVACHVGCCTCSTLLASVLTLLGYLPGVIYAVLVTTGNNCVRQED